MFFTVKGRSLICSLGIISLRLIATGTITVSSDHKKQNSPLPTAVDGCLVDCVAVVFWMSPAGASRERKGCGAGLMFIDEEKCEKKKKELAECQIAECPPALIFGLLHAEKKH